jgi:glyoxylase-like metal-dependent hydrolase (beta-lactamase superfamily II)
VIGDDGVVVIDTFFTVDAAEQLRAAIQSRTKLPIKFVVNTHYHIDHVAGNGVFAKTGAAVVAQRNVRGWIHEENLRLIGDFLTPELKALTESIAAPSVDYEGASHLYLGSRAIHVRSFRHTGGELDRRRSPTRRSRSW